jgi:hypothetical protein
MCSSSFSFLEVAGWAGRVWVLEVFFFFFWCGGLGVDAVNLHRVPLALASWRLLFGGGKEALGR